MTVGTKMHQTLASLEAATAEMKTFALDTDDKTAKAAFSQYAKQLEGICQGFSSRVQYIGQQEPQYQVFNEAIRKQEAEQKSNKVKMQIKGCAFKFVMT